MKDFVIVTSLFNLSDVRRGDGRGWEDYLEWFGKTLKVKCPFIIFTEEETAEFIREKRGDLPTHIITTKLEDVPLYGLRERIQDVLDSDDYKEKMLDVDRVECQDSMYSVIQYSKFKWLKEAARVNPFESRYYFWLDAGASRFLQVRDYQNEYPSESALAQLSQIDNTFLLQYNPDYYMDLINADTLDADYLWDNRSFICGSMFGGNIDSINSVEEEIDKILDMMIERGCVNNEQIALGYLCKNNEDMFTKFYRKNPDKHLELFQEMA
tara:strand:+ start:287 stop:1090 length:804 start_codon:yes stop_codon:yes gene_type:complete